MRKRRVYQRAKYVYAFANCLRFYKAQSTNVTINQNGKFDVGTGDFAFSIWVNSLNHTVSHDLLFKDPGVTTQPRITFSLGSPAGAVANSCFFRIIFAGNQVLDLFVGNAIPPNTWCHIVYQRDGVANGTGNNNSSNIKIYVNGVHRASGNGSTITNPTMNNTAALSLGRTLDGYLDDFIVFNRALSLAEIQAIYNNGNGAGPPEATWPNILAYWFFNESNGRVLNDYSNTFNPSQTTFQNGTLVNYTDAQVAANGQPQSGQTAWCDHFTRNPITSL